MKENELEFSDWPMFDLLMTNEELCRELLEVVLDAPVSNIEYIIAENDIRPTLTNHGVRLDAYVKTENEVCNIEMQTVKRAKLGRRLRFYQGAMDTLALRRGEHYGNLPPCYIVFICLHDPFNAGLPVYTLNVKCQENTSVKTDHGFTWIVLAAPAWDRLPPGRLRNLLHYIATGEAGDDRFATKLAAAVRAANGDEAWRKENLAAQKRWHSLQPMPMLAVHDSRNSASRKSFLALTSPLHVRRTRASEGSSSDARGSPGAER